jgi:hypothetical protein
MDTSHSRTNSQVKAQLKEIAATCKGDLADA